MFSLLRIPPKIRHSRTSRLKVHAHWAWTVLCLLNDWSLGGNHKQRQVIEWLHAFNLFKKMKKMLFFFLLALFFSNDLQAKKANAIWYFLEKKSASITEDENIFVQYGIYTKYANESYGQAPYPTMRIKATNKSDKIIYIDLGTSYLKKNDVAFVIYNPTITTRMTGQSVGVGVNVGTIASAVGIGGMVGTALGGVNVGGSKSSSVTTTTYAQRLVSIPPKSSVLLEDVPIFTPGSEKALGDLFYYKEVGMGKMKWTACLSYKFNDVESGGVNDYSEDNTLFTIGCYLNYSFSENFTSSKGIETTYYVKKVVGSSWGYSFGAVTRSLT